MFGGADRLRVSIRFAPHLQTGNRGKCAGFESLGRNPWIASGGKRAVHSTNRLGDSGLSVGLFPCSVSAEDRRGNSRSERSARSRKAFEGSPANHLVRGIPQEFPGGHEVVACRWIPTVRSGTSTSPTDGRSVVRHSGSSKEIEAKASAEPLTLENQHMHLEQVC